MSDPDLTKIRKGKFSGQNKRKPGKKMSQRIRQRRFKASPHGVRRLNQRQARCRSNANRED